MEDNMEQYDVIVVGAGVGGVSIATELALQGRTVLLIDKVTSVANPFKGELIQPGSILTFQRTGALPYLMNAGATPIHRLVSTSSEGEELCAMDYRLLPTSKNYCLTHTYEKIVDSLSRSIPSNVDVQLGVRYIESLRDDSGRFIGAKMVRRGEKPFCVQADLLVGADGVSSTIRKESGVTVTPNTYGHQVIAFDLGDMKDFKFEANTIITSYGMRVIYPMPENRGRLYMQIPHGFVNKIGKTGLLPWVDSQVSLCHHLRGIRSQILDSIPSCRVLSARRFIASSFHSRGIVLLGDAAHAVHPMAGQGMNAAVADAACLADSLTGVDLDNHGAIDHSLENYGNIRRKEVKTVFEFSHRFAELFTTTTHPLGLMRSKYILKCHGRNNRLCYKIMHNISGLGYKHFTIFDRLQQVGLFDPNANKVLI